MRLLTLMWTSYIPPLKAACAGGGVTLTAYSNKQIQLRPELLEEFRRDMADQDCLLLYRTSDPFWDELEASIQAAGIRCPIVVVGSEPALWGLSSVAPEVAANAYRYLLYNGAREPGEPAPLPSRHAARPAGRLRGAAAGGLGGGVPSEAAAGL